MAKKLTKTTRSFTEKGLYNPENFTIIGTKDGDINSLKDVLETLSSNGEEISITIKVEDSVETIEE